jgi:hypothetical protein
MKAYNDLTTNDLNWVELGILTTLLKEVVGSVLYVDAARIVNLGIIERLTPGTHIFEARLEPNKLPEQIKQWAVLKILSTQGKKK